jgi:putative CRISPR-associated protein (TIGR02619 family)
MQNPLFVLSPCGTSLLTNQANNSERKLVSHYANTQQLDRIPLADRTILQSLAARIPDNLESAELDLAAKMSAELNGIIKLYRGQLDRSHDYHLLLCTDTWLGETTATFVAQWLKQKGFCVEVKRQPDLQTKDITSFQLALSDLVSWCEETIPGYRHSGYRIVFNLTGGFKSVQGFLQTLATFYADETIYIFETAQDLLRIPRLPVEMAAEGTVRQNLELFRRLSMDLPVAATSNIPETLLMTVDGKIALSPWGDLVWEQTKKTLYREQLFPSPSQKLHFASTFSRSLQGLSAHRLELVNERIDQLARCIETNGQYNPPSLDFKSLKGNPHPPSTHEIDAWHDGDAQRLFGHHDNRGFVLDALDRPLH